MLPGETGAHVSRCFPFFFFFFFFLNGTEWKNMSILKQSLGRSRLSESLAGDLCIMWFITEFMLGFFKSSVSCYMGLLNCFLLFIHENFVLTVQKSLPQHNFNVHYQSQEWWHRKTSLSTSKSVFAHYNLCITHLQKLSSFSSPSFKLPNIVLRASIGEYRHAPN